MAQVDGKNEVLRLARQGLRVANNSSDEMNKTHIFSSSNAANAITMTTNGGTAETILIKSTAGTGAASLNLVSTLGGLTATITKAVAVTANGITLTGSASGGTVTADTLTVTGASTLTGAVGAAAIATFSNSTAATTVSTGAIVTSGGIGVAKSIVVGGNLAVTGAVTGLSAQLRLGYDTLVTPVTTSGTLTLKGAVTANITTYLKVYHNNTAYYIPMLTAAQADA